jgi:hypothetical protein
MDLLPAMEHANHTVTSNGVCADADLGAHPANHLTAA